jgi:hypothetical protein
MDSHILWHDFNYMDEYALVVSPGCEILIPKNMHIETGGRWIKE